MDAASQWTEKLMGHELWENLMLGNYAVMFGNYDVNIWWFFQEVLFCGGNNLENQTQSQDIVVQTHPNENDVAQK